ncbi:MAG: DUF5606 domain-containing protein [Flavobacteriales bacterium]|jgi:hypothetical protein|nr:DUF5606 domain-containing protein [Flavobacteriales bacterium]MCB0759030.1 DUF5606 domain-containing protein [Flavobacteriales bacterium]
MDLSKIISITGKSGLYRVVAQGRQALIAESLADKKRIPVHSSVRVSSLDEVSMYTKGDDVLLSTVLEKLHALEKGKLSVDPKGDLEVLYDKLGEALPNYDRDRIYSSDVRKFFMWYQMLVAAGIFEEDKKAKKKAGAEKEEKDKDKKKVKGTAAKSAPKKKAATAKRTTAPKTGGASKAKAKPMHKGAQRGS